MLRLSWENVRNEIEMLRLSWENVRIEIEMLRFSWENVSSAHIFLPIDVWSEKHNGFV